MSVRPFVRPLKFRLTFFSNCSCSNRFKGQRSFEVKLSVRPFVRPLKFRLTFFKLLLFEQVRFNYNQTWIIGALWEHSHYNARGGHMTRSKAIWGQIVIVISINLFQMAPVRTGSLLLQPNLVHRCTMGTFSLWRSSRSHDKVKGHWRSNCYMYIQLTFFKLLLFEQVRFNYNQTWYIGALWEPSRIFKFCSNRFASITTKLGS